MRIMSTNTVVTRYAHECPKTQDKGTNDGRTKAKPIRNKIHYELLTKTGRRELSFLVRTKKHKRVNFHQKN
jgi:predicted nucleic acid-binding OB-fold protein